jgi:anti-anti-sigma factor
MGSSVGRDATAELGSFPRIVTLDEQRFVLRVWGDEDRATQSLRRPPLSRVLTTLREDLEVDLTDLSFADSSFMLDLAMLARRLRHAGKHMILRNAQPHVQRLIELMGIDRMDGVRMALATATA